jgi:hypothetical protein
LLVISYALSVKYIRKPDLKLLTLISILPVISFFIKLNNGIIWETEETVYNVKSVDGIINRVKRCGDGTVPYWSLQHAREWSAQCHVVIDEIVGATHREILADERFHEIVLRYITRAGSEQVENV